MTGTQRIQAVLNHQPVDRTPISGWYHMPLVDRSIDQFAEAIIASAAVNHWDFIKVMTNGHFYTEAYGGDIRFSVNPRQWNGTVVKYPLCGKEDAERFPVLGIDNPVWQRELKLVRKLKAHYGDSLPIISTIFNPLTALQECAGRADPKPMLRLMEEAPQALHHALEAMTQTNLIYLDGLFQEHIDGIFLSSQYATSTILTDEQYMEFCYPYERRILEHCKGHTWFNIAHICGYRSLRMAPYIQYEDDILQALNWMSFSKGVPQDEISTIAQVRKQTGKVFICGIDQDHDLEYDRATTKALLAKRYLDSVRGNGNNQFIFAPGCCLKTGGSPLNSLLYEVVEEWGRQN